MQVIPVSHPEPRKRYESNIIRCPSGRMQESINVLARVDGLGQTRRRLTLHLITRVLWVILWIFTSNTLPCTVEQYRQQRRCTMIRSPEI